MWKVSFNCLRQQASRLVSALPIVIIVNPGCPNLTTHTHTRPKFFYVMQGEARGFDQNWSTNESQSTLSFVLCWFYFLFGLKKNTDCLVGIGNDRIEYWQLWIASSLGCFASTYSNNRVMHPIYFFFSRNGPAAMFDLKK